MARKPLRVGVVGLGHLGSRHAQIYTSMRGVELTAVCDIDPSRTEPFAKACGCEAFTDYRALVGKVDALSLAIPTSLHGSIGKVLLSKGIHLLIEKPIASTLAQADALVRMAQNQHCILQIGHVERFNAAIHAALKRLTHPRFIEVHRLSSYPFRGTDVSVVLDVMIHDLDLILALVRSQTTKIEALGVPVLSKNEDIANARISFASGCVANLTASRINHEAIRRIRVFQEDSYLSIDYKEQSVDFARKAGSRIERLKLPVNRRPPLETELKAFIRSVMHGHPPAVSGEEGRAALALALRIEQAMRKVNHSPQRPGAHQRRPIKA